MTLLIKSKANETVDPRDVLPLDEVIPLSEYWFQRFPGAGGGQTVLVADKTYNTTKYAGHPRDVQIWIISMSGGNCHGLMLRTTTTPYDVLKTNFDSYDLFVDAMAVQAVGHCD